MLWNFQLCVPAVFMQNEKKPVIFMFLFLFFPFSKNAV